MRIVVALAAVALASCATPETVAVQTPDKWIGGTEEEFWAAKTECENYGAAYLEFPYSYTRRWRECMAGKGWKALDPRAKWQYPLPY